MKQLFSFLSVLIFFSPVEAKLFKNSYVSFEIPETWECKSFGTDWVCHSKFQEKKVEALITSTAKIAGPLDTRQQYMDYLQQPKTWKNTQGEQINSEKVAPAKEVFLNKFPWVDSIHKNSEVKAYISRYAGTVCCPNASSKLGILLVLSAHQDHYTKYSGDFVKTINSLRVLDIEKAVSKVRENQATGSEAGMSSYLEGLFDDDSQADLAKGPAGAKILGLKPIQWALMGLVGLAGLGYLFIRRRKGRGRSRRSRRRK